jgi:hypothetical protein
MLDKLLSTVFVIFLSPDKSAIYVLNEFPASQKTRLSETSDPKPGAAVADRPI